MQDPAHCCRVFVDLLLSRLADERLPPIVRSACAAYLASFLARASFASPHLIAGMSTCPPSILAIASDALHPMSIIPGFHDLFLDLNYLSVSSRWSWYVGLHGGGSKVALQMFLLMLCMSAQNEQTGWLRMPDPCIRSLSAFCYIAMAVHTTTLLNILAEMSIILTCAETCMATLHTQACIP